MKYFFCPFLPAYKPKDLARRSWSETYLTKGFGKKEAKHFCPNRGFAQFYQEAEYKTENVTNITE